MKKLVFLLLTIGVVMFFTSSRTTISSDSRVGTKAPDLSIANETAGSLGSEF